MKVLMLIPLLSSLEGVGEPVQLNEGEVHDLRSPVAEGLIASQYAREWRPDSWHEEPKSEEPKSEEPAKDDLVGGLKPDPTDEQKFKAALSDDEKSRRAAIPIIEAWRFLPENVRSDLAMRIVGDNSVAESDIDVDGVISAEVERRVLETSQQ